MLEILKEIEPGTPITFLTEDIVDFVEADEIQVSAIDIIQSDDGEIVLIELNDFYLVGHNFDSDPRYFIYQQLDTGTIEDLEQDGYHFLTDDCDFRSKVVSRDEGKTHIYKHSDVGALYDLIGTTDEEEVAISLCEYISSSHHLSNMLVLIRDNENLTIFQGFEIDETDITVSDDNQD